MKRSRFNLSNYVLGNIDFGKLYPVHIQEVCMGDTFKGRTHALIRMEPMVSPVMHPMFVRLHTWYVPYRLVWDGFEDFVVSGGSLGVECPNLPKITLTDADCTKGSLADVMGIPPTAKGMKVSALPFRAYNLIWNNFYRDQDLQDELKVPTDNNDDSDLERNIQRVSYAKDYFTTARPWTQRGDEVSIPVNSTAGVTGSVMSLNVTFKVNGIKQSVNNFALTLPKTLLSSGFSGSNLFFEVANPAFVNNNKSEVRLTNAAGVEVVWSGVVPAVDLDSWIRAFGERFSISVTLNSINSTAESVVDYSKSMPNSYSWTDNVIANYSASNAGGNVDIMELRAALALQRFQEARAKYGHRYVDFLQYHGIKPSDARLQLPEYVYGGKSVIQISDVVQTAGAGDSPVGSLYGKGLSAMKSKGFVRFFEEHGVLLTLCSIVPLNMYANCLERFWSAKTPLDFWIKEFQHIGMQEVWQSEIYARQGADEVVFGYQGRYDDMRHKQSRVFGDMRGGLLKSWNLARDFGEPPVLNPSFIECQPDNSRIMATTNTLPFVCMFRNHYQAKRLLAKRAKTIIV